MFGQNFLNCRHYYVDRGSYHSEIITVPNAILSISSNLCFSTECANECHKNKNKCGFIIQRLVSGKFYCQTACKTNISINIISFSVLHSFLCPEKIVI